MGPLGHLGGLRLFLLASTFLAWSFLFLFFRNRCACLVVRFIRTQLFLSPLVGDQVALCNWVLSWGLDARSWFCFGAAVSLCPQWGQ